MTTQWRSTNGETARAQAAHEFRLRHLIIPSSFVIRASSFLLALMREQAIPVRIAEHRHETNRRFDLLHLEGHPAFLELRDRRVDVVDFERHGRPITRRFPIGMTT